MVSTDNCYRLTDKTENLELQFICKSEPVIPSLAKELAKTKLPLTRKTDKLILIENLLDLECFSSSIFVVCPHLQLSRFVASRFAIQ